MKVFLALIVGILVGVAGLWYYNGTRQGGSSTTSLTNQTQAAVKSAGDAVQEKLRSLNLNPQEVKEELERTGQVVRRKAREAGQAIADNAADARITGAIKAKLVANTDLSSLGISVNTTDGIVTLSGSVPSAEHLSKAILIAMETEGVREVISTVQVRTRTSQK